jgi:hypothetical protein
MSEAAPVKNRGNAGKGRPKGARNKATVAMKEAISHVYAGLQDKTKKDHGHFLQWAEENPTEFYKIAAKLLPLQVNADHSGDIRHEVVRRIVDDRK